MAEVQTSSESGETAHQFIEFIMMQAQNAAFALGQIPHPETGEAPVNLDLARLFIDQLELLRIKTRGNLSNEELGVLNNAISNLQMAFVEVSQDAGHVPAPAPASASAPAAPPAEIAAETPAPSSVESPAASEGDSKKKFSKSYGA